MTRRFAPLLLIPLCLTCYGFYAIRPSNGPAFGINIDLSKPRAIAWPCEVSIVGDEGEKGLRIAPKVGQGWRGKVGGQASYSFFVPHEGKYYMWANCLWYDECANAIFAQIDQQDKAIIGNDPVYDEWHWVRGFATKLKQGTHTLTLSNHSDHIAVQNIVLANSFSLGPEQTETTFSDIFYDGFDGCDQGNFKQWKQLSGTWQAVDPSSNVCSAENALLCHCENQATILYYNKDWKQYSLDLEVKLLPSEVTSGSVGICFAVQDPSNYGLLQITPNRDNNSAHIAVIMVQNQVTDLLSESDLPINFDQWMPIQTRLDHKNITITLMNHSPISIPLKHPIHGGIGLKLARLA